MRLIALLTLLSVAPWAAEASTVVVNGDFETWSGGSPTSWTVAGNAVATQVPGIGGSGSSMLISTTSLSAADAVIQTLSQSSDDLFTVSVDFTMTQPGAGGRALNLQLYGGNPTGTTLLLNTRINDAGALQYFDGVPGSGGLWRTVAQSGAANGWVGSGSEAVYQLVISGSLDSNSVSYSLYDLTHSLTLAQDVLATDPWQLASLDPNATLTQIRFARGNGGTVDYTVDNLFVAVPEPSRAALALIGLTLLGGRRRR